VGPLNDPDMQQVADSVSFWRTPFVLVVEVTGEAEASNVLWGSILSAMSTGVR